jgi:signal transduction histidine kinase
VVSLVPRMAAWNAAPASRSARSSLATRSCVSAIATLRVTPATGPRRPSRDCRCNQLELAILNLAINACDAMPEGLTGGIAHDFNNLLTAVVGNLELLLEGGSQLELDGR